MRSRAGIVQALNSQSDNEVQAPSESPRRHHANVRRIDAIVMAIVATGVALPLVYASGVQDGVANGVAGLVALGSGARRWTLWIPYGQVCLLAMLLAAGLTAVGCRRVRVGGRWRAFQCSILLVRPTVAAWLGVLLLMGWRDFIHAIGGRFLEPVMRWDWSDVFVCAGVMAAGSSAAFFIVPGWRAWSTRVRHRKPPLTRPSDAKDGTSDEFKEVRAWFESDEPITHPDQDRFEHKEIAASIASRIHNYSSNWTEPASVQLLGPRGGGKSSMRGMVEHYLRELTSGTRSQRYEVVPVSVWEYRDADAVYRAIIRALIEGVARVAPVADLQTVPSAYAKLIQRADGSLGSLAEAATAQRDPERLIAMIGDRAVGAGVNVVLWIDDMERFQVEKPEALNAIGSLLVLIRQTNGLSFVLARAEPGAESAVNAEAAKASFDVDKLVDVSEVLRLDDEHVRRLLAAFRQECFSRGRDRVRLLEEADATAATLRHLEHNRILSMPGIGSRAGALVATLTTPRQLKQVLRRVWHAWTSTDGLMGEISFDDLLCFTALREQSQPILVRNDDSSSTLSWGELMSSETLLSSVLKPPDKDDDDQWFQVRSRTHALARSIGRAMSVGRAPGPVRIDKSDAGLSLLHLCRRSHSEGMPHQSPFQPHSVYMERAIRERVGPEGPDQPTIRAIDQLNAATSSPARANAIRVFVEAMYDRDDTSYSTVSRLRWMVRSARLSAIMKAVGLRAPDSISIREAGYSHDSLAFGRVRRLISERTGTSEQCHSRAVRLAVWLALKRRPDLARIAITDLGPELDVSNSAPVNWWANALAALVPACVRAFSGPDGAKQLAEILREGSPWLLHHLIFAHWVHLDDRLPDPATWIPFVPAILAAGREEPEAVGRALSCLISTVNRSYGGLATDDYGRVGKSEYVTPVIDPSLFEDTFTAYAKELYQLVSTVDPDSERDEAEKIRLREVKQAALGWLTRHDDNWEGASTSDELSD